MESIKLKTNKPQETASAVGRLLQNAAQTVESTKRIPVSIEIVRTQLRVSCKMNFAQEEK